MRKSILMVGGTLALLGSWAHADIVGVGANISYWNSDVSGDAATNGDAVDLENDLDLSSDDNANISLYVEHPVPLLPNVRVNYTSLEMDGEGQLSANFDGIALGTTVQSDLELDQLDLTLYYEVLDNWVNLDLGLTARDLDGELTVRDTAGVFAVSETEIDAVVPLAYAAARFDLPFTGVSVGGDINGIAYGGDAIYDLTAYGQYELSLLQLRAGYRQITIDYEDGDDTLDLDIGGPFISAGLVF
ncbi:MAG: TIGR04219 family outer membrane beta-barrel protein [Marinobacter sp.]|uniref:TIGR04219 family outer membrane beta-barrel protein n=1 Tax=Marinobacter sp. TaxID=50741 RepID=UPI00299DE0A5|nr:TIGR04219 family outer membrane beta-barrel protein [Marinobacter sp.]MDX1754862.1 TIGR04219 family outer membrane beta-barrel protein [Marinobacter sp.]